MYPAYMAATSKVRPDTLDAASKVWKDAPIARNIAVMHCIG
jgi:hypothetical protein